MGFFRPPDSCDVGATRAWLMVALVALVALAVASIALLAQAVLLWRREIRLGVAWWGRVPLALPVVWAAVCGVAVMWALVAYGNEPDFSRCPPGTECINPGGPARLPLPVLGAAQYILLVAAVLLILAGSRSLACRAGVKWRGRESLLVAAS